MTYESVKLSGEMRGVNKVNKTRSAKYVDIASYLHCLKRFESLQARTILRTADYQNMTI